MIISKLEAGKTFRWKEFNGHLASPNTRVLSWLYHQVTRAQADEINDANKPKVFHHLLSHPQQIQFYFFMLRQDSFVWFLKPRNNWKNEIPEIMERGYRSHYRCPFLKAWASLAGRLLRNLLFGHETLVLLLKLFSFDFQWN